VKNWDLSRGAGRRRNSTPRQKALRLLSRKPYTEKQLREKLRQGFSSEEIEPVLTDLRASHLINDEAYAREFASVSLLSRKKGLRWILRKLQEKGVSKEIRNQVIAQWAEEEKGIARQVAQKWIEKGMSTQQIARGLQNRGFTSPTIHHTLKLYSGGNTDEYVSDNFLDRD